MFNSEKKIASGFKCPLPYNPNASIGQMILHWLDRSPNKISQIYHDDGMSLTCQELKTLSIRVALNLKNAGFKTGDVVGLVGKNSTYVVPIIIGCFLLGCPIASLDPDFVMHEVDHVLRHVKPKVVFCDDCAVPRMREILVEHQIESGIVSLMNSVANSQGFTRRLRVWDQISGLRVEV
jgi:4-coumarate--CoA ligase